MRKIMASPAISEQDLFRLSFKRFKFAKNLQKLSQEKISSKSDEDPSEVILLDSSQEEIRTSSTDNLQPRSSPSKSDYSDFKEHSSFGLKAPSTWKIFDLKFPKGLIFIRNPFTAEGQRYWIRRSVVDFPNNKSYITNIDNLESKENKSIKSKLNEEEFYKKLRWVTFGFHHNWDTKIYSEGSKSEFPPDLADLTYFIAKVLGFLDFKAEAATANYYHLDSTLSGHVDRSEVNQEAPLLSLSFGQPAIFLIGGQTKLIRPQGILLRSGDVAVMSGESRLSYHGVPKIFFSQDEPWNEIKIESNANSDLNSECSKNSNGSSANKKPKLDVNLERVTDNNSLICDELKSNLCEESNPKTLVCDWNSFLVKYVSKSRINLNVRQVLFSGQTELSNVSAENN